MRRSVTACTQGGCSSSVRSSLIVTIAPPASSSESRTRATSARSVQWKDAANVATCAPGSTRVARPLESPSNQVTFCHPGCHGVLTAEPKHVRDGIDRDDLPRVASQRHGELSAATTWRRSRCCCGRAPPASQGGRPHAPGNCASSARYPGHGGFEEAFGTGGHGGVENALNTDESQTRISSVEISTTGRQAVAASAGTVRRACTMQYSNASASATHDASMMLVLHPTVDQRRSTVARLDEHADGGGRATVAVEDAHLVVVQLGGGRLRECRRERLAQGGVDGVDRARCRRRPCGRRRPRCAP